MCREDWNSRWNCPGGYKCNYPTNFSITADNTVCTPTCEDASDCKNTTTGNACVNGGCSLCVNNLDCAGTTYFCNQDSKWCDECQSTSDCDPGYPCAMGHCVPPSDGRHIPWWFWVLIGLGAVVLFLIVCYCRRKCKKKPEPERTYHSVPSQPR